MVVDDDPTRNRLTATLTYEIRDCWIPAQTGDRLAFQVADMSIARELGPLNGTDRRTDIFLGRPRKVTRELRMEMPRSWPGQGWEHRYQAPGVNFINRLEFSGRTIIGFKELHINAWTMPASRAGDYGDVAKKLHENLLKIWAKERFGNICSPAAAKRSIAMIIWLSLIALWVLLQVANLQAPANRSLPSLGGPSNKAQTTAP